MRAAFICDAVRTPIGRHGGALSSLRADDLAAIPIAALVERRHLDPSAIDEVILGCANQAGEDNRNVARMAALLAGLPTSVPGVTLNRLCASGADAVGTAARAIMAGEAEVIVAGGVESMSRAPYVIAKAASAYARGQTMEDTTIGWRLINPRMRSAYGVDSMPETAENVADLHNISRADQDKFALSSQRRTGDAQAQGLLARDLVPVTIEGRKGPITISTDEHPRPDTSLEMLAALKPIVRPGGAVTAGNASGVNDGAAAMIIASEAAIARHNLTPRARIVAMTTAGVEPHLMGLGPVPACRRLFQRLNCSADEFDVVEINEAFAAQVVPSLRELGIDPFDARVNRLGGAIALGHPLGMSGARIVMAATRGLQDTKTRRALVTMCVGVGQGLALALEAA